MTDKPAREFWLLDFEYHEEPQCYWDGMIKGKPIDGQIHVIEKKAFDELKAELESMTDYYREQLAVHEAERDTLTKRLERMQKMLTEVVECAGMGIFLYGHNERGIKCIDEIREALKEGAE